MSRWSISSSRIRRRNIEIAKLVTPKNAKYWNDKLAEARSRVELATSNYDSLLSKLREVGDVDKLKEVLKSASGWAAPPERVGDDVNLKRAVILSTVARGRCIEPGKFELDLVVDPGKKAKKRVLRRYLTGLSV